MNNDLLKSNQEETRFLIKGLRYSLGLSLCNIDEVGLATGLVGNWECGLCLPNKKNLGILENLIKKSGKDYKELIRIGQLNFGDLIKSIAKQLGISEQILIRFIISKYMHIEDTIFLNKLKEGKIDLAPKTKLTLLKLKERIENDDSDKDARKIIFELQKESTFSKLDNLKMKILVTEYLKSQKRLLKETKLKYKDSSSSEWLHNRANIPEKVLSRIKNTYPNLLIKIEKQVRDNNSMIHQQWKRAENFQEIIEFQYRYEPFETKVFDLFDNICDNLVKNVLVTDKAFNYITEIDLIGGYKGKKIYFICKGSDKQHIIMNRKIIKTNINLIQRYLKPDIIFLVVSCNYLYNKSYFEDRNIFFVDKDDLNEIKKSNDMSFIFLRKNKKENNKLHNLEAFRTSNKLSKIQLRALLNCSGYLYRRLKMDNYVSAKNKNNLTKLMKINSIRKLHFKANRNLTFKSERALILKYIRKFLNITLKKVSEKIGFSKEFIQNIEAGITTSKHLENKIEDYLKTFKDFDTQKQRAIKFIQSEKEKWRKAESFNKIINFKDKPNKGDKLENEVASKLISQSYLVFENPILSNKELNFKKEVDIYAIKGNKEIIIECTEGRNNIKWQDKAELLSEISKELKCDVIFVSKQTSSFSKKVLKTRNILNLKVNELMEHI